MLEALFVLADGHREIAGVSFTANDTYG